ncbi:hypothetical protein SK128_023397 [Halocaridina rubra]|uniref:Alpha-1,3-mannosyl-glycoprotein 2-beta-N-acetylglucosaminyltransferase n=1 Tax=Halocaridina rubra TaxID=373956 RepID=A0AAN8WRU8_HALRR
MTKDKGMFEENWPKNQFMSMWVECKSSFEGWNLQSGFCQENTRNPSFSHLQTGQRPVTCDDESKFIDGWSLPNGTSWKFLEPVPGEGIVLTVFNQRNGELVLRKVFPLGMYWFHWADFQWYMERISPGRLVILTVSVAGCFGLRQASHLLTQMGSSFAQFLTISAHWSWIFMKGGQTISETAVIEGPAPVFHHTILKLSNLPDPGTRTTSITDRARWNYCSKEGGMGSLCDEHSPMVLPLPPSPPLNAAAMALLAKIPVVVTAGKRHQYIYHTITNLLSAPGAQKDNLVVVLGDNPFSTTSLLDILSVTYTTIRVGGNHNSKLFAYYRNVYKFINETFADAPAVIILDEDVQVSHDFFSYMSQTLWLLEKDPSLYCINAYSVSGFTNRAYSASRLFRGAVQVEWGYAVSLNFVREALNIWPKEQQDIRIVLYDYWLYNTVRRGRECVYPEMARSKHYGAGVNTFTNSITMERTFMNRTVVQEAGVRLAHVDRLIQSTWQNDIIKNITQANILTGNPCDLNFIPIWRQSNIENHTLYVFYYQLNGIEEEGYIIPDVTQYYHLFSCLGTWSISEQGQHEGVSIVPLAVNVLLYVVGVPYSSYSHLMPQGIPLWDINKISEKEFEIVEENRLNRDQFSVNFPNLNMTSEKLINMLTSP